MLLASSSVGAPVLVPLALVRVVMPRMLAIQLVLLATRLVLVLVTHVLTLARVVTTSMQVR